jgi:putative transposase
MQTSNILEENKSLAADRTSRPALCEETCPIAETPFARHYQDDSRHVVQLQSVFREANDPKPKNCIGLELRNSAKMMPKQEGGMKQKRYSEEQIVYALKQVDAERKASEVCRQLGVSEPTFYAWKRKFAGVGIPEVRELRQLRVENRKLKQLVADLTWDKHLCRRVVEKGLKPTGRRQLVK